MPPKSIKTRKKSGDVGAPSALPDVGVLYINKDIISAIDNELSKYPGLSVHDAAISVSSAVIQFKLNLIKNSGITKTIQVWKGLFSEKSLLHKFYFQLFQLKLVTTSEAFLKCFAKFGQI